MSFWAGNRPSNQATLVGLRFYDERSRKVEKALQVNFEMYQVYIISIYLSI